MVTTIESYDTDWLWYLVANGSYTIESKSWSLIA